MWQETTPPEVTSLPESGSIGRGGIGSNRDFPRELILESKSSLGITFQNATVCSYQDGWRSAWDEYVYRHPSASIFHLTAWKRVVERTFKFEPRYLLVEEGGRIRGVLPLFLVSSLLFGRSLVSTPIAVYGGICADNDQMGFRLRLAACEMAREERVQYLELREQAAVAISEFQTKELYVTFDLKLPQTADELLRGFPRDTRYMIRKAQKNGLEAAVDNSQLDSFYEIYARSFHHLGTPVFPKRLFQIVLDELREQSELTVVRDANKKAFAAVLSFRFRDWVLPYFGGSLVESRPLAANNFMYFEVMRRALEAGVHNFDFGRSKLGSGSYDFKTQWNMRVRPLPYQFFLVRRKSMPNFSPANPQFKLAISLWKMLPLSITRILGSTMVRAFP